jgi:hypothetical protein
MKRILRQPLLWLIVQAALLVVLLWGAGRLRPLIHPDTATYENVDWSSLPAVWSGIRTPGYPLFLDTAAFAAPRHGAVPILQVVAYILGAWALYFGLRASGYGGWIALACASTFYYRDDLLRLTPDVLSDSLAVSLSLMAVGCFLATNARDGTWYRWSLLVLLTLVTCLVRPAYLFLVPLWPLLALFLDTLLWRRDRPRWQLLRKAILLFLGVTAPLVAVCVLRWALVGHFGFVSFGGYNIIGITGQLLDDPLVGELPADSRRLAEEILRVRERRPGYEPPANFLAMERMYNVMVWELSVPAAQGLYAGDTVAVNDALRDLSFEILKRRPSGYVRWLCWNTLHAVSESAKLFATNAAVLLTMALFCGVHALQLCFGWMPLAGDQQRHAAAVRFRESHLLFWTALLYWTTNCGLVVLVEPAQFRYMIAGNLLLPAAMACFVAQYADLVLRAVRAPTVAPNPNARQLT